MVGWCGLLLITSNPCFGDVVKCGGIHVVPLFQPALLNGISSGMVDKPFAQESAKRFIT